MSLSSSMTGMTFSDKFYHILSTDTIRLQKLMEITQYCVTFLITSIVMTEIIKIVLPEITTDDVKKWSNSKLFIITIFYLGIFGSLVYYTRKISLLFPFQRITDNYKPNFHGEALLASVTISGKVIGTLFTQYTVCINEILYRVDDKFGKTKIIKKLLYY